MKQVLVKKKEHKITVIKQFHSVSVPFTLTYHQSERFCSKSSSLWLLLLFLLCCYAVACAPNTLRAFRADSSPATS